MNATQDHSFLSRIKATKRAIIKDKYYYFLLVLPLVYFLIFKYIPMAGNIIAFRKFTPGKSMFGVAWVGLKYFKLFMNDAAFWSAFRNTIILSILNIFVFFPIPIVFSLLLNEAHPLTFKKTVQTVAYLPRFFSTVVVVGLVKELLSPSTGIINTLIRMFGFEPIFFVNQAEWFRLIYVGSDIWQYMGFNAIIYIAALSNLDPQLYDASAVDGASRLMQTRHITLPGLMPTIVITLIFAVGNALTVGFEKVLLLYSPITYQTADVISTFVYRIGLQNSNYSYATAVGLFQSLVALTLIYLTNAFARKVSENSLW